MLTNVTDYHIQEEFVKKMEFSIFIKIAYLLFMFTFCFIFVYIPRKAITKNNGELSPTATRILDLTNYFALGVFISTCFVMLTPHVQTHFVTTFTAFGWKVDDSYKAMQALSVCGFLLVFFLEKFLDFCQKNNNHDSVENLFLDIARDKTHGKSNVYNSKGYLVTFQDEDEENDDDELNRKDVAMKNDMNINQTNSLISSNDDLYDDDDYFNAENERLFNENTSKPQALKRNYNKNNIVISSNSNSNSSSNNNGNSNNNSNNYNNIKNKGITNSAHHTSHCNKLVVGGSHVDKNDKYGHFDVRCAAMLVALCVHSIFEGMAIGLINGLWQFLSLALAIGVHQLVAALAVGISLTRRRLSSCSYLLSALIFSFAIPIGIGIGMGVLMLSGNLSSMGNPVAKLVSVSIQSMTVGTFVYVIFIEVLPSEFDRRKDVFWKCLLLILGISIIIITSLLLMRS